MMEIQRTGIWTAEAPLHICTPQDCPESGAYYVTCIDAGNVYRMSGPYATHAGALSDVDRALKAASDHDGRAWFMSWGTVRYTVDLGPGRLQLAGLLHLLDVEA